MEHPTQTPISNREEVYLLPGSLGIYQTLLYMKWLALDASHFRLFRDWALALGEGLQGVELASHLITYAHDHLQYANDPDEFEYLKDPYLIMKEIEEEGFSQGDCDDHACFLAALLSVHGIHNSIIALELTDQPGEEGFNHVVNSLPTEGGSKIIDISSKEDTIFYQIRETLKIDIL